MTIEIKRTFHGSTQTKIDNETYNSSTREDGSIIFQSENVLAERTLKYAFYSHYHPYVTQLIQKLIAQSISGLQSADTELKDGISDKPTDKNYKLYKDFFKEVYEPNDELIDPQSYPVDKLEFHHLAAYAIYNWELFFHIPFTVAVHLSKNQRFQEAQHWFHYIFDPTDDSDGPTPERFWKVKPFQTTDVESIQKILASLSAGAEQELLKSQGLRKSQGLQELQELKEQELRKLQELKDRTTVSIDAWKNNPFRPHAVARYRPTAYMFKTVMAYLDNLIDWGDSLFQQDTIESINEATQIYVMAANILGPRPQAVPKKGSTNPQTYAQLRTDLGRLGTVLQELETEVLFNSFPNPREVNTNPQTKAINSIGKALYFAVPRNEKLLGYWDTVSDRLYKIHNSLNLQGTFRQLPLFQPPIDPALLARAAASGVDTSAVIGSLNQPLPLVRFQLLSQKATEICQEVKTLGNSLLSAIEKEDNEALSLLRSRHEQIILKLNQTLKYSQWQEAIKTREALEKSLTNVAQRYLHYQSLLGKKDSEIQEIPELDALDIDLLKTEKSSQVDPEDLGWINILYDTGVDESYILTGGQPITSKEKQELKDLQVAQQKQYSAIAIEILGSELSLIPQFNANLQPVGMGASTGFGGTQLSRIASMVASSVRAEAGQASYAANMAAKTGAYTRRSQDWTFQSNLALGEINQIVKQLRAAQIREFIARQDYENHQKQIQNAKEIEHFLKGESISINGIKQKKVSTQAFYAWMKREVRNLYSQCFQFAFDVAKKAERALQHELGNPELNYIKFNYQAGKEGLLAGEKLHLDIKRMEMAYYDQNQREYELTKHISLLQLAPKKLLDLKYEGNCEIQVPEEVFDMDCPGHYFRRIKNVAVTIPCVTGPYTSINCTLTLVKSTIRKSAALANDSYGDSTTNTEDPRFDTYYGSSQSIVTSTGQNDSGLFETNLRDERYLPFENSGVISTWRLELPGKPEKDEPLSFDYSTISDVILHFRYTAREGGALLKEKAMENLKKKIQAVGTTRLFSIRHEFAAAWSKLTDIKNPEPRLELKFRKEHYPFWSQNFLEKEVTFEFYSTTGKGFQKQENVELPESKLPTGSKEFSKFEDLKSIKELWLLVNWAEPKPEGENK